MGQCQYTQHLWHYWGHKSRKKKGTAGTKKSQEDVLLFYEESRFGPKQVETKMVSPGLATNSFFFYLLFVTNHWFEINDPLSGKHYSLPFLPATPSSPSRTLEGLFELTRRPSRALDSPRALLPELQRYKDTVRCAALGAEVPGHRQEQLTQTLIVRLLKTHFFTPFLDCEKSTE